MVKPVVKQTHSSAKKKDGNTKKKERKKEYKVHLFFFPAISGNNGLIYSEFENQSSFKFIFQ